MGDQSVKAFSDLDTRSSFIQHLLNDVQALEYMLDNDMIESGIHRIGAEQEFCLVSNNWRPEKNAEEILDLVDDPHFTTELARFNLEVNLDPFELKKGSFLKVENQLKELLGKVEEAAEKLNTKVLLTGILPTISKNELVFEYMTPKPRYWSLNESMKGFRGADFHLHIKGVDELTIKHDSVLFEACNTSFQMHLQISPEDFISSYNWAQAISGPVLGVCTNSPLLLGRELWSETRIALFQQSIDTRSSSYALKDQLPRVAFGDQWAQNSIADIFKHDIAHHKIILAREVKKNSLEELAQGRIPKLEALCVHNGTIYRWNRPCYGVGGGKPHVRIENRYIPSGPTIADEMANFAFWIGLMMGRPSQYDDMPAVMDFRDAKANFIRAARTGKASILLWEDQLISVRDLVLNELLPLAENGLKKANISNENIERLLGIIEQRTCKITGSQWSIGNYRKLRNKMKPDDALLALTKALYYNQNSGDPVHEWPMLKSEPKTHEYAHQLGHIMSTRLFTVNENDLAELAINIMEWKNIHHLPVENNDGELTGILTKTHVDRYKSQNGNNDSLLVSELMEKNMYTADTNMEISDAISLMKANEIGCLPIKHDDHLVGIVTIKDLIEFDTND